MKADRTLTFLTWSMAFLSAAAAGSGIFTEGGPGPYEIETWRGTTVTLYGKGLYQHMSAEVAIQGIAQDYVTLFLAVPLLLFAWWKARGGAVRWRLALSGVVGYFFVTYLFYTVMAMYHALFLVQVALLGLSFFALLRLLLTFELGRMPAAFSTRAPHRLAGGFLVFNAVIIALLWLGVVLPPLLDGSIYPGAVEHYTTLVVQGLDLGLLLPLCLVVGLALRRRQPLGLLGGTVYLVFLALLMTALVAKLVAMGLAGAAVMPAIVIIPVIQVVAIVLAVLMLGFAEGRRSPDEGLGKGVHEQRKR